MLNELFDQLAEAIGAADGVAIYKVGPVARDLGLTLIDESGGSDFNLEYWIEDDDTGERLVLGYVLIPVEAVGQSADQRFDLTLSQGDQIIRERWWRSVEGVLVESLPPPIEPA